LCSLRFNSSDVPIFRTAERGEFCDRVVLVVSKVAGRFLSVLGNQLFMP